MDKVELSIPVVSAGYPTSMLRVVDDVLWAWVTEVASEPRGLALKLEQSKRDLDVYNPPLLARLAQIEETRKKQYNKLDMLAEMYRPEDMKKRSELKAMFERLRSETVDLLEDLRQQEEDAGVHLEEVTLTQEFIRSWEKHAHKIRDKMHLFTFAERRESIESLNITGTIAVEDGLKVLYVHLYNHTSRIPLEGSTSSGTNGASQDSPPAGIPPGHTSTDARSSRSFGEISPQCRMSLAPMWRCCANAASS